MKQSHADKQWLPLQRRLAVCKSHDPFGPGGREQKEMLRSFLNKNEALNEEVHCAAHKLVRTGGCDHTNFALSALLDFAWAVIVLIYGAIKERQLIFPSVETHYKEMHDQLLQQFNTCRSSWLEEISEYRDLKRKKCWTIAMENSLNAAMEQDVYRFIPEDALSQEHRCYFEQALKECLKVALLYGSDTFEDPSWLLKEKLSTAEAEIANLQKELSRMQAALREADEELSQRAAKTTFRRPLPAPESSAMTSEAMQATIDAAELQTTICKQRLEAALAKLSAIGFLDNELEKEDLNIEPIMERLVKNTPAWIEMEKKFTANQSELEALRLRLEQLRVEAEKEKALKDKCLAEKEKALKEAERLAQLQEGLERQQRYLESKAETQAKRKMSKNTQVDDLALEMSALRAENASLRTRIAELEEQTNQLIAEREVEGPSKNTVSVQTSGGVFDPDDLARLQQNLELAALKMKDMEGTLEDLRGLYDQTINTFEDKGYDVTDFKSAFDMFAQSRECAAVFTRLWMDALRRLCDQLQAQIAKTNMAVVENEIRNVEDIELKVKGEGLNHLFNMLRKQVHPPVQPAPAAIIPVHWVYLRPFDNAELELRAMGQWCPTGPSLVTLPESCSGHKPSEAKSQRPMSAQRVPTHRRRPQSAPQSRRRPGSAPSSKGFAESRIRGKDNVPNFHADKRVGECCQNLPISKLVSRGDPQARKTPSKTAFADKDARSQPKRRPSSSAGLRSLPELGGGSQQASTWRDRGG